MEYKYVVIGAGPAGVIAAETLVQNKALQNKNNGEVLLISDEREPPYSRMAIPYFLVGSIKEDGTYLRKTKDYYSSNAIHLLQGKVKTLDENAKSLTLEDGNKITYDKLCIATGSHPIKPPINGLDDPLVQHCWTLDDSRKIIELARPGSKVVLMGAGFIGCIILEALVNRKVQLSVIEMGDRMVPRMLDATCGGLIKKWCESKKVNVHISSKITEVVRKGEALSIHLDSGNALKADLLVVAAGVAPNIDFLANNNIETGGGIRVNAQMQTSNADIYAAGDVAEAKDFSTHAWSVHAIQPVAADHGRIAALNMLGKTNLHQGSLGMNVLDTLGLISTSFGKWDGIEGGDQAIRLDEENFRYTRLEFDGDHLIGAQTLGRTDHVGVIRGLIQNKIPLGDWKEKLMQDPNLLMEAYVDLGHV